MNVVFEVTPKCNHKCVYCYNVWKYRKYDEKEIGINTWKSTVTQLKNDFGVKVISLSGGEPLLYKDLFELVSFIRSEGLKINLLTNASLLDENYVQRLIASGVSLFEVSLISPDKRCHNRLTGVNNFEEVLNGISNLSFHKANFITVFVATKYNTRLLKKTLELSVALGSKGIMFNRLNPASKEQISLMPSVEELKRSLRYLDSFGKKNPFFICSSIPIPPCVIDMSEYPNVVHNYCPSGGRGSYFTIDFAGNMRICNHSPYILGNIMRQSLYEIFNSEHIQRYKTGVPAHCSKCESVVSCKGSCKASSEACYGILDRLDPFVERNVLNIVY